MTTDEILMDVEERLEKAVNVFRDELRGLRTGRAVCLHKGRFKWRRVLRDDAPPRPLCGLGCRPVRVRQTPRSIGSAASTGLGNENTHTHV